MPPMNIDDTIQYVRSARRRSRRGDSDVAIGCMSPRELVRPDRDESRATRVRRVLRSECSAAGTPIGRAL